MYRTGSFIEGETFLYDLDPRVKLAAMVFLSILILWVKPPMALIIGIALMGTVRFAGISFRIIEQAVKPLLFFIVLIFLVHVVFDRSGTPSDKASVGISFLWIGLQQGLLVVWRFLCLIVAGVLLTMTTTPSQMIAAVKYFLRPLQPLRVPVEDIAVMLMLALRLMPVLLLEKEKVETAQKARGHHLQGAGFPIRIKAFLSLTRTILLGVFRRADELALAMDARNFRRGESRTSLTELQFTFTDYLTLAVLSVSTIIFVALNSVFS